MDGKRKADEHVCGGKKPRVGFTGDLEVFNGVLSKPDEVDLPDKNTYHFISYSTYLPNWTCQEALRELLSNAIDQSRAVADKFGIFGDLKIREDPDRLALHIGSHLLAEVKWKFGKHGYRHSYYDSTLPGATKRKCKWHKIKNAETMCVDVINYTSHLTWESFQLGKTTKRGSKNMIGTHGEGLSGAAIVLNRLRCDFVVHCDNYSGRVVNLADRVYILPTNPEKRRKDDVVYKNAVHFRIVLPPPGNLFDVSKLIATIRLSETVPRVVAQRGQLLTSLELKGKQYNRASTWQRVPSTCSATTSWIPTKTCCRAVTATFTPWMPLRGSAAASCPRRYYRARMCASACWSALCTPHSMPQELPAPYRTALT
jgi:hypothetical protein